MITPGRSKEGKAGPFVILLAEDNEKNRILIRDVLGYSGYEVIEATDGTEAVARAKEKIPDLILMDIQMPVMDGITALKILKADPATKDIRAIALTSFAMSGDKENCLSAGFDGYMSKPVDIEKLSEMITKYLD